MKNRSVATYARDWAKGSGCVEAQGNMILMMV